MSSNDKLTAPEDWVKEQVKILGGNANNFNIMELAMASARTDVMELLVKRDAAIGRQKNADGDMLIHIAAGCGYTDAVKWWLNYDKELVVAKWWLNHDENLVVAKGKNGNTPMHRAAMGGNVDIIECLVENGADLYARNDNNYSPMECAVLCDKTESIKCLANLDNNVVNAKNGDGQTPIFTAAMGNENGGKIKSIECLAELRANVNEKDNEGRTPIFWAVQANHINSIRCLVKCGADINVKDNDGATPIVLAAFKSSFECLKCLVELGADLTKDKIGEKAAFIATQMNRPEEAKWLSTQEAIQRTQEEIPRTQNVTGLLTEEVNINPENDERYVDRGVLYIQAGELNSAINDFNKALELNPKNARAYENRGMAYVQKEIYNNAISDFTNAIRLNPNTKNTYKLRGAAYGVMGEHDKSIADYEDALALDLNDKDVAYALENAKKLREQGRWIEERILRENKAKKKRQFWTIFRIVLGGIVGGLISNEFVAEGGEWGVACWVIVIGLPILFFIIPLFGRGGASNGAGCYIGLGAGIAFIIVLFMCFAFHSLIISIAVGVIVGALIGYLTKVARDKGW
jgi:ankyrin repeat protein